MPELPVPKDGETFADAVLEVAVKELCNCANTGMNTKVLAHYANCEYVKWYESVIKT